MDFAVCSPLRVGNAVSDGQTAKSTLFLNSTSRADTGYGRSLPLLLLLLLLLLHPLLLLHQRLVTVFHPTLLLIYSPFSCFAPNPHKI